MLDALHRELSARAFYLENQEIETIYLGGGTPSMLSADELQRLLDVVFKNFRMTSAPEITLEANPDDLTYFKILELKRTPINRLSIGVQSFRDEDLQWMNRAHTSTQADYAVKCAQDRGFDNITIDLIYSVPGLSAQAWQHNIEKALDLEVQHISAYSLTIEPKTVLGNQLAKGELHPAPDEVSEEQFRVLRQMLLRAGFEHYEVSNFCRPGMQSRHNSSYWKGAHYLGVGPSAHSFNGSSRQWNVANNAKYISGITNGNPNFEIEQLSETMRFNEYLMTGLRTQWGIDLSHIQQEFGIDLRQREQTQLMSFLQQGLLIEEENHIRLTESGLLRADRISSDLFIVES